ncbi:MAG: ribosome recycling factor [Candidatus Kerfeldbacteria bacterium]|jgi:ribosome recycling factor
MSIISDKEFYFEDAINYLKNELNQIRTGTANPSLVENIKVDYYGTLTPLNQLANISIPDPKSIVIQPWDKNIMKEIEKSIQQTDLGLNPVNEGEQLRIPIPPLTEERRKDLAKKVHEKTEDCKISIRNTREEIWKEIKEKKNNGEISEDDMFNQQKELQKLIEEKNNLTKEIGEGKEKEVLTL